jgi:1,4-alpha-glucan branching enzyme
MLGEDTVLYELHLGDWLVTCQHGEVKVMSDADMLTLVLAAIKAKGMLQ